MKSYTMIASSVIETDRFLELPLTAQALYFHLNLHADSMGAIDSLIIPLRSCKASEDDLRLLQDDGWITSIGEVWFVTHWLCHNKVREKDRRSQHLSLLKKYAQVENGQPYRLKKEYAPGVPGGCPGNAPGAPGDCPGHTPASKVGTNLPTNGAVALSEHYSAYAGDICARCGDYLTQGICFRCRAEHLADAGEAGQ